MKKPGYWWVFAIGTTVLWGIWGAFIETPEKNGFPATLGYCVWALVMLIPAYFALRNIQWKLDRDKDSIWFGSVIGILGAAGQLILFQTLRLGPAYLVFPLISLSPLITILLSLVFLKEKAKTASWTGIILAIMAIPLLSYQAPENGSHGTLWVFLSLLVFFAWGIQAFYMKKANHTMKAESIFFYMTLTGIALIPVALFMTDFSQEINWGADGPLLAAGIQLLNAVGALSLVYAFRYGKAIIISPMANAGAPVITVVLSLLLYTVFPHWIVLTGMVLAVVAISFMSIEE